MSKHDSMDAALDRIRYVYQFWGRHAGLYAAQDLVTFLGRSQAIRGAAVRALGRRSGERVLEVGCGTGRNLPYLQRAVGPDGEIVAFDYSADMLAAAERLARRRGWRNVRFVQGDAAELQVAGPFDGVLSVLAVSAIPDWRAALARCHEVLRPDGTIAVCDARLLAGGPGRLLNPLIEPLYRWGAAWNPGRDIAGELQRLFGNVRTQIRAGGLYQIAIADKQEEST